MKSVDENAALPSQEKKLNMQETLTGIYFQQETSIPALSNFPA